MTQNTSRIWVITTDGCWARWAPAPHERWDIFDELGDRVQLVADPRSQGGVYFLKSDGSVGFVDVDLGVEKAFPGIAAKQIAVGQNGRLWAITADGALARWAPAPHERWDVYGGTFDMRSYLVGDPRSEGGIFFIQPDGAVAFREVDQGIDRTFPNVNSQRIAVGQNGRLWTITAQGWARWAPAPYERWDIYNDDLDGRVQLVGDPRSEGGIYFLKSDGTVGFRNVDENVNQTFPGILATELTVSDPG